MDLSNLDETIKQMGSSLDFDKILQLVMEIAAAGPAISMGVERASPFVAAIAELISHGGKPSDDQWAALRQRLDANSAELKKAAADLPKAVTVAKVAAPIKAGTVKVEKKDE